MPSHSGSLFSGFSYALCCIGSAVAATPIIDLGYTGVQGAQVETIGVDSYLGLKFAAAPVGDLRWCAPVPIELGSNSSFGEVFNATSHGPQCVQGLPGWWESVAPVLAGAQSSGDPFPSSEDCLSLDVFAPSNSQNKSLPVLLFIHGGGYTLGNGADAGGPNLVSHSNGTIIFVSVQYRLGAYGFLSSDALTEDGTANAGLLDQRAAIDWVHRHIDAFGGDPDKVTIWGPSAGGGSVTDQLVLFGGEDQPPFRAAISEYPWGQSYKRQKRLDIQYTDLLAASNCSSLGCLRDLPEEDLVNATSATYQTGYEAGKYAYGDFYYGPVVDGDIIRDYPQREIESGHFSKVALLTDRSGYEGAAFTNFSTSTWKQTVNNLKLLWPEASDIFFTRLEQLYPLSDFSGAYFDAEFFSGPTINFLTAALNRTLVGDSEYWRAQQIYGDYVINCPSYYQALAFSEANVPAYKLIFNSGTELHGAPSPFLATFASESSSPELANKMQDYWISFTSTLDPSAIVYSNASRRVWPRYTGGNGTNFVVLEVNGTDIGVRPDADANARCEFFYGRSGTVLN